MKKKIKAKNKRVGALHALDLFKGKSANEVAALVKNTGNGFLSSPEWKKMRVEAVEFFGCVCMRCGKHCDKSTINVDHIKPRKYYPDLALDFNNLQVLCGSCNKEKGNMDFTNHQAAYIDPAFKNIKHFI